MNPKSVLFGRVPAQPTIELMQVALRHSNRYLYNRPVFLEPQTIRLRPQVANGLRLRHYRLTIRPQPVGMTWLEDPEGNEVAHVWFEGLTDRLTVISSAVVELDSRPPFDYLLHPPSAQQLPLEYPASLARRLRRSQSGSVDSEAAALAAEVLKTTGGGTLETLLALNRHLSMSLRHEIRDIGPPRPPSETLRLGRGACRDLSRVMIDGCRSLGLAARFVSGYKIEDNRTADHHLHAWVEVYLPGAGWRGFDPSQGLAVTDQHIPLAAAHHPIDAAPIVGSYRGTEIEAHFDFSLRIRSPSL